MKITLIRKDEEQGTEALSLCDTDAFFEKVKTENKAGHISELREILPRLAGSSARYVHIDKLPRVYPAVACESLTLNDVKVFNPWYSQNGDALDVESCKNV